MALEADEQRHAAELSAKLWSQARENLSAADRALIKIFDQEQHHNILNDLLTTAREKQVQALNKRWRYTRKDGTVIVYRDYFDRIIRHIAKFQQAADFLVAADVSGHVALPWTGVKFFLLLTTQNIDKWASVLEGVEFMTHEISYYGIFEVIYLRRDFAATKQLADALTQSYTMILQYLAGARRYYEQHSYERFLRSISSFDDDLESTKTAITSQRKEIDRLRAMIDGQQQQEIGQSLRTLDENQQANQDQLISIMRDIEKPWDALQTQLTSIEKELTVIHNEIDANSRADMLPKILKHLKPGKVSDYDQKLRALTPGTAQWVFETHPFQNWVDGESSLLFISGGPGTGKSHLSTSVIDHLLQTPAVQGVHSSSVGCYYFHGHEKRTQSMLNAFCTIVYQLATNDDAYCARAAAACDRSPCYEMTDLPTVWNDFVTAESVRCSGLPLFLIFDGIDEADQSDLVEFLKLTSASDLNQLKIRVLLAGRPEMKHIIEARLDGKSYENIEIIGKSNQGDIQKFSQAHYDEYIPNPTRYPALRKKVISKLAEQANGNFLWVDLMYKELSRIKNAKQLSAAIENLPTGGLHNVYDRIFHRIEQETTSDERLVIREVFCWFSCSDSPLYLSLLNDLVKACGHNQIYDVETLLDETCSSLFVQTDLRSRFFDHSDKSEVSTHDELDVAGSVQASGKHDESISEDEDDSDDDAYDMDEAELEDLERDDELHRGRQSSILIEPRHASLRDYLNRDDIRSGLVLLQPQQAKAQVVLSTLRMFCLEIDTDCRSWAIPMGELFDHLDSLNDKYVSDAQLGELVKCIHDFYHMEIVGKHLSKIASYYAIYTPNFSFGKNTDLQHRNRLAVQRWLSIGKAKITAELNPEVILWIDTILNDPLTFLVSIAKTCINEWLYCNETSEPMEGRFRLAWRFLISTNLIPPLPGDFSENEFIDPQDELTFAKVDAYNYLANIVDEERTLETYLAIAKTALRATRNNVARVSYERALELARKEGSIEQLREIYHTQICDFVDVRDWHCREGASEAMNRYLELSVRLDAKVLGRFGVIRYNLGDTTRALEDFRKSIELEPSGPDQMSTNLFLAFFELGDFDGMMDEVERAGCTIIADWIHWQVPRLEYMLRMIMHAARTTGKSDQLSQILNCGTQEPFPDIEDSHLSKYHSLFLLYLGWMYSEYTGQPDQALGFLNEAFFQLDDILEVQCFDPEQDELIYCRFDTLSQLILKKATNPQFESEHVEEMYYLLEDLWRRAETVRKIELSIGHYGNAVSFPLAKFCLEHGKREQARKLLDDHFRNAIEMLEDGVAGPYAQYAYRALARVLYLNGQFEHAHIAILLRKFCLLKRFMKQPYAFNSAPGPSKPPNSEEAQTKSVESHSQDPVMKCHFHWTRKPDERDTGTCAQWHMCEDGFLLDWWQTTYTCMTCVNVELCEKCHGKLDNNTGKDMLYVCDPRHEFVKYPMEGMEKIERDEFTLRGKTVRFVDWLGRVKKEWKKGTLFK